MMKVNQLGLETLEEELLLPGHSACPGCGAALLVRHTLKAMGWRTIVVVAPGCMSAVISSRVAVPITRVAYAATAAVASGVMAALDVQGDTTTQVLCLAGDGGTHDIGLQALSGAVERGDDFIWVCFDNEAYMNTGIQRSSATPAGAWTATTPRSSPKKEPKKNMMEIMAAHRAPYAATVSIAYPQDMLRKTRKAASQKGVKFLHFHGACPTGWRFAPDLAVQVSRLAVDSKVFPLYETEHGLDYTLQQPPREVPVREYLRLQGRFSHLSEDEIEIIQRNTDWEWEHLAAKCSGFSKLSQDY